MSEQQLRWWQWVLLGELVLWMIAAATTFLPGKTRSGWSFAHLFFDDPSALEKFLVSLAATHLLVGVIALVFWITEKRSRTDKGDH